MSPGSPEGPEGARRGSELTASCYDAVMHTPEDVTLKALAQAKAVDADCYVSTMTHGAVTGARGVQR